MNFVSVNDSKYLNVILMLLSKQPFVLLEIRTIMWNGQEVPRCCGLSCCSDEQLYDSFNGELWGEWRCLISPHEV